MSTALQIDLDPLSVKQLIAEEERLYAQATAAAGPFPLRSEDVLHFGTLQHYQCWQRGPNSRVYLTLPELWTTVGGQFACREFLIFEDERLTYGQVLEAAKGLAHGMCKSGVLQKGTTIAIAARNYPEFVIAFVAVTGFLSGVVLPVNSWGTGDELKYALEDSQAAWIIADRERLDLTLPYLKDLGIKAVCMRAGASALPSDVPRFEDVVQVGLQNPVADGMQPRVEQDDRAMLMYTSGTTSRPKGVVMTQRGVLAAINMIRLLNYSPNSEVHEQPQVIQLVPVPLFHVNGTHNMLLSGPCLGKKLVLLKKWDATHALELIQAEKVNILFGVPTMTYELVNHPEFASYDTSSLVSVGGGGAPFVAPMVKQVAKKFSNAAAGTGYGLTETNSTVTLIGGSLFAARPSSVGRPVWNIEVCVLGAGDTKLPVGSIGEICVHGAIIMDGYLHKPDKTKEAFHIDKDGRLWFRTGDLGRLDEDNFLYIMDRAKDIIIRGGENISCAEVEAALYEHPAVAEVAAFGFPNERLGEVVGCAMVFKVGPKEPSEEELSAHMAQRLAAFKVAKVLIKWPEASLPRGATGKIQKRDIKEMALKLASENSGRLCKL